MSSKKDKIEIDTERLAKNYQNQAYIDKKLNLKLQKPLISSSATLKLQNSFKNSKKNYPYNERISSENLEFSPSKISNSKSSKKCLNCNLSQKEIEDYFKTVLLELDQLEFQDPYTIYYAIKDKYTNVMKDLELKLHGKIFLNIEKIRYGFFACRKNF